MLRTTWFIPLLSGLYWFSCWDPARHEAVPDWRAGVAGFAGSMIALLAARQFIRWMT